MNTDPITVLLVDDEPDVAELAATFLEREDDRLTVITETDTRDGLTRLDEEPIDCIVSDYQMPRMDGLDFLATVRESYPDLPFILYTGQGSEAVAEDAIEAGVTSYLQKENGTAQYTVLANRIENTVANYRTHRHASDLEQEYELVAETATDVFCTVDLLTDTISWSEGIAQFGYDPADIDPSTEWAFEQMHPDDRDRIRQLYDARLAREAGAFDELTADRGTFSAEYRFRRADGTYAHVEGRGVLLFEDGDPVKMVGTLTDITERKERERELVETHKRMERALETTDAVVWDVYIQSGEVSYYPAAQTLYNTDIESIDEFIEQVHPADRQQVAEAIETGLESGTYEVEFRIENDDKVRWISDKGWIEHDAEGTPIRATGVGRDITERKERQQSLHETQQRFQAVLDTAPVDVYMVDLEGHVLLVNEQGRQSFGMTEDPTGKHFSEILPDVQTFLETLSDHLDRVADGETVKEEVEIPTPTGSEYVLSVKAPVRDADGDPYAMCGVATDITERVEKEQELERETERLDRFATTLSHDLCSPLQVVDGHLTLAQEECDSEHLDRATEALDRAEAISKDVLTLARADDTVTKPTEVSLQGVATEAWATVGRDSATLDVADTPESVACDRGHMRRLFENVLRNAIEHGGDDVTVRLGSLSEGEGFYIEDDGPGIPAADADQLFEWGYSTRADGHGYGLAIVEQLVAAHGWTITATTGRDGGARFEIATKGDRSSRMAPPEQDGAGKPDR